MERHASMKQLYFLHIPKTAGRYISEGIKNSLDISGVSHHITTHFPNNNNFINKAYISMHAGTYPLDKIPNLDVATIVRNPIDARISYFNFIYNKALYSREEYSKIESPLEKLRYYLFEDTNFENHNNYQSRFICNSADERSFKPLEFNRDHYEEMMYPFLRKGEGFNWFVNNDKTTLENAIAQVNRFKIVYTLDNIDQFKDEINKWFKDNYGIDISFSSKRVNNSVTNFGDGKYLGSADLLALLAEQDKDQILKNNSIDYELYNYINNNKSIDRS